MGVADAGILTPFLFPQPQRVFGVTLVPSDGHATDDVPVALVRTWRETSPDIASVVYQFYVARIDAPSYSGRALVVRAEGNVSGVTGVGLSGLDIAAQQTGRTSLFVTTQAWTRWFGATRNRADGSITVDGSRRVVRSALPPGVVLPGVPRSFAALAVGPASALVSGRLLVRLPEGLTAAAAANRLEAAANLTSPGRDRIRRVALVPLRALSEAAVPSGFVFAALGFALFSLAVINYGYLTALAARSRLPSRRIQLAVGASPASLLVQSFIELTLLGITIACVTVLASQALMDQLAVDLQTALVLPRPPQVFAGTAAIGSLGLIACVVVVGLTVEHVATRNAARLVPFGNESAVHGMPKSQRAVVCSLVALSTMLVTITNTAAWVYVSIATASGRLDTQDVLYSSVRFAAPGKQLPPAEVLPLLGTLEETLATVNGVERVALVDTLPLLAAPMHEPVQVMGGPDLLRTRIQRVGPDYFDVLRIPVALGRVIEGRDMVSPPEVAVVSKSFASARLDGSPLGSVLTLGGNVYRVVGVASDVRDSGLTRPGGPTVYVPNSDPMYPRYGAARGVLVRVTPGSGEVVAPAIDAAVRRLDRFARVAPVAPLSGQVEPSLRTPRLYGASTAIFGVLGVLLGGGGTLAVLVVMANRRRKGTAIKQACGASRRDIAVDHLRLTVPPVAIGLGVGLLAGISVSRVFEAGVYSENPLGIGGWMWAAVVMLLVTGVAVVWPLAGEQDEELSVLLRQ
jgi:MacB-like periplasmic core domain/FtsX-like permease family